MSTEHKKTDQDIQSDVVKELAWDTRLSTTEIGVLVKHGVVTLTGTVDAWAKVGAAEAAAHRVVGVLDVANELAVELPGSAHRTDADVAEAVRHAIEWDTLVPNELIRSTVSHGVVTLEGTVPYWSQRYDSERAVERLAGVSRVVNRIEVEPKDEVDLQDARRAVAKALELHAHREAARIDLQADERVVDVRGVVHTWREHAAVLGAVRGTRGVRQVHDHLVVRP
ncbi:MAG TPA: BON domain-containing protein [Polyangia bacterium]|nr:BON domain-containing protein [Polyangia bacterium]